MKYDQSLYNDEFFEWHQTHVHDSEVDCGKLLAQWWQPTSIGDFGCGIGSFLLGAKEKGVLVQGFELGGEHASKYTLPTISPYIDFNKDISKEMFNGKYDITLCIEVAEHIEEKNANQLIDNLVWATKKMCVFTAATTGQQGTGHINCQPHDYWKDKFEERGLKFNEIVTNALLRLWTDIAPDYITKNLMVFI